MPILREVISRIWPEIDRILPLQPRIDEAGKPTPGAPSGWAAVRAWCEENARRIEGVLSPGIGEDLDLLVVALDVDTAVAAGIADPPARGSAYDASRLCATVKSWLKAKKRRALPNEVVIAIPAMAMEAWVLAALFPKEQRPELHAVPAEELLRRRKLRRNRLGKPAKDLAAYQIFANQVGARLDRVRKRCPEADRFCCKLERMRRVLGDTVGET